MFSIWYHFPPSAIDYCCCCSHRAGAWNVIKRHQTSSNSHVVFKITHYTAIYLVFYSSYWLIVRSCLEAYSLFLFIVRDNAFDYFTIVSLFDCQCSFDAVSWRLMTFHAPALWLQQGPILWTLLSQAIDNWNRNKAFFVALIQNNKDNAYHRDWFLKLLINLIAYYLLSPHLHPIGCSLL